ALSQMVGRQLPFFSLLVPFWVVWAMAGFRGLLGVWPAALTAGVAFAIPQFLVSNFHGPWLVDIVASLSSIVATVCLLRFWGSKAECDSDRADTWEPSVGRGPPRAVAKDFSSRGDRFAGTFAPPLPAVAAPIHDSSRIRAAWTPWIVLSLLVFIWGVPFV